MAPNWRERVKSALRWSEQYTKTDMVYLATSGFWINLNFGFVAVCSFLLSIAFANFLSKDAYGTYQYILSIATLLTAFTLTGFNTAITRSVAQGFDGELRASIRPQLLWNLLPAAAALIWSGYYLLHGQAELGFGIFFVALSLPILNAFNSYNAYLNGKRDFKQYSLYAIAGNAAYYICISLGVFLVPQALPLIFINLFVTTAAPVFLYFRTIRKFGASGDPDPDALPYARHLSVMNALSTIANQIDNILVFHFLGATDLALYSIATLLPERLGSAFGSVVSAALPKFTEHDLSEIRANLVKRLTLLLASLLVAAGLYALFAPFVFHLIYPKYDVAVGYSQLYALTFVSYIGSLVVSALSAHRKVRQLYIFNTAVPLVQIVFQVVGIVVWGLWGLVLGKVASAVLSSAAAIVLIYF